ncbi:hypothetical protein, partial [Pseudomonas typographi]
MFTARRIRARVAWLLFTLVLLNGLACSFGHGQMMAAQPAKAPMAMMQHNDQGLAGMHKPAPMQGMKTPFEDCFFAGSVPLALLVFAALGWLLRTPQQCPPHA